MDKKELRNFIRAEKRKCSGEQLKQMSEQIISKLVCHPRFEQAQTVCLYSSLPDEVSTHELLEHARVDKRVLLPTVVGENMEFHEYTSTSVLSEGCFSIQESTGPLFDDYAEIDLIVVPGMAFDAEGNRLGRGKGYYDKFLCQVDAYKIGVCFPFQYVDHVPHDEHDICVNEVVTL